jgi:S1-C subfamily serine protease/uncharacterized RDD family membrane protein YckC
MFCKSCGKKIIEGVRFCKYCGYNLIATNESKIGIIDKEKYGKFWPRAGAWIIDQSLVIIALIIVVIFIGTWSEDWDTGIAFLGLVIYSTFFLKVYGATPGKMLYGLKVVDEKTDGELNFGKSLGRSLSYFISSIALGFGFLKIAFDKEKHKGWHDRLAGTIVLQREYKKPRAIILTLIAVIFYLWLIIYGYSSNEVIDPYPIRSGTREIKNELSLNPELFNQASDLQPAGRKTGESYSQRFSNATNSNDLAYLDFDLRKELAAVVTVACPIDDSEEWNVGSGVITSDNGVILTNFHVIQDTTQYYCTIGITNDLSKEPEYIYDADFIFSADGQEFTILNEELDVALLQIVSAKDSYQLPNKFPAISKIGNSDTLNINDKMYIVGYPSFGGGTITFTEGVMSGRLGDDLIKTSAKIDSGNSGGAAFNENGEFVGIPTLIYEGTAEGLGYIIGIDSVKYWLDQILE